MPKTVQVLNQDIRLQPVSGSDYICLTDIARHKDEKRTDYLISNWLRNRNTIEFLGLWEQINNPSFNPIEFDGIKSQAGLNSFISPPSSGSSAPAPLGFSRKPAATVAPMPTPISPLNSPLGSRWSSSST
jgi:hypothetical protein